VNHLLHPEADEEFASTVRYYSEISPELGVRFYREMKFVGTRNLSENLIRPCADISAAIFLTPSFFWRNLISFGLSP